MTNKQKIDAALARTPGAPIPTALLNGAMWVLARNNMSANQIMALPDAGAKLTIDAIHEAGSMMVTGAGQFGFPFIDAMGGKVDNDIVAGASEIIERPLKTIEDIDKFDLNECIARLKDSFEYKSSVLQVKEMRKILGDTEYINGGGFGPFTIASQLLGVGDFMEALFDDEDGYVKKLMDFAGEMVYAWVEGMVEAGVDMVLIAEPVASGDLISPDMFDEFVLPMVKEFTARCKKICPLFALHICGNTQRAVGQLVGSGIDFISVDSIDLVKATEDAKGEFAFFGNLNPADIIVGKDADGVYADAKALCDKMKSLGGLILGPGCDLPPITKLENLQAMAKAAADA